MINSLEIPELRGYNTKTFYIPGRTNVKETFGPLGYRKTSYAGEVTTQFHIAPIHYIGVDRKWHDMKEIASNYGNRMGMILKNGWEDKVDFGYLVWYLKRNALIRGRGIRTEVEQGTGIKKLELPLLLNTVGTFYPDANPESTSVDGRAITLNKATFTAARDAANADSASDSATGDSYFYTKGDPFDPGTFSISIMFYLFDTSTIGSSATISAASVNIYLTTVNTVLGGFNTSIVETNPATNTAIVVGDYSTRVFTDLGNTLMSGWSLNSYNTMNLNATGLTKVSKTGITKLGMTADGDISNTAPTNENLLANLMWADNAGTSQDPYLSVTYSAGGGISTSNFLLMGIGI